MLTARRAFAGFVVSYTAVRVAVDDADVAEADIVLMFA